MSITNELTVDAKAVIPAWQKVLPEFIQPSGECSIVADEKFTNAIIIHIKDDGRSHYSFDFRVKYVDNREIDVELLDVEKAGDHVNEQTEIVQSIVKDYVRNIHECAQSLKELTNR